MHPHGDGGDQRAENVEQPSQQRRGRRRVLPQPRGVERLGGRWRGRGRRGGQSQRHGRRSSPVRRAAGGGRSAATRRWFDQCVLRNDGRSEGGGSGALPCVHHDSHACACGAAEGSDSPPGPPRPQRPTLPPPRFPWRRDRRRTTPRSRLPRRMRRHRAPASEPPPRRRCPGARRSETSGKPAPTIVARSGKRPIAPDDIGPRRQQRVGRRDRRHALRLGTAGRCVAGRGSTCRPPRHRAPPRRRPGPTACRLRHGRSHRPPRRSACCRSVAPVAPPAAPRRERGRRTVAKREPKVPVAESADANTVP